MTKELFIKRMQLIQNFHSQQETLSCLIEKVIDGYAVVNFGGYLVDEMIEMINESLGIEDKDLLSWWLYEDVDKYIYFKDCGKEVVVSVQTLDELYDYIINEPIMICKL